MTIIVAVKFAKGVVVATDSRSTYGEAEYMRDTERKIETLNGCIDDCLFIFHVRHDSLSRASAKLCQNFVPNSK
jgi:ATP-dependent protease HslVU (ClpYQ) peptidase subunit